MKTKICSKCKKEKEIKEFHKNKNREDGLHAWCKICAGENSKIWYQKNREKRIKYEKAYHQKNKKRINERHKKWYQKNKKHCNESDMKRRKNNPIKYWCMGTIKQHKYKGFKVLFTWKDLLPIAEKTKYCPLCGAELDWRYGTGFNSNSPSLDRTNNENFLRLSFNPNVQIICNRCNKTKQDRTMTEFINYCEMIYKKFKEN